MPKHGWIKGTETLVDNGPRSQRLNLVLLGDGFQLEELDEYAAKAQQALSHLASVRPFSYRLKDAMNVFRVDVVSTDSGVADPEACDGSGAAPKTYFDSSFCGEPNVRRALTVDKAVVVDTCDQLVPEWEFALVLANSPVWGGTRSGSVCTTSLANGFEQIFVHELGHAISGLGDEYPYRAGCEQDGPDRTYRGSEPAAANLTIARDRASLKWRQWVAPDTPLPTKTTTDCSKCDSSENPQPSWTVGLYEGGHYKVCGVFRPQFNCIMRDSSSGSFCQVCFNSLDTTLRPYVPRVVHQWLALRRPDGTWTNDAGPVTLGLPVPVDEVASCVSDENLFAFLLSGGALYWNQRYLSGTWRFSAFAGLDLGATGVADIAATTFGPRPVLAFTASGRSYVAFRQLDGTWTAPEIVSLPATEVPESISAASAAGRLYICLTSRNSVWMCTRLADGSWTPAENVSQAVKGLGVPSNLACVTMGSTLHLLVSTNNTVMRAVRGADGKWPAAFEDVGNACAGLEGTESLECAALEDELALVVAGGAGTSWANWTTAGWSRSTTAIGVLPANARRVSADYIADELVVVSEI
jgi:IgA Peptidase M64